MRLTFEWTAGSAKFQLEEANVAGRCEFLNLDDGVSRRGRASRAPFYPFPGSAELTFGSFEAPRAVLAA